MCCDQCGGRLTRVPRLLNERFKWQAAYECDACLRRTGIPQRYMLYAMRKSVCPRCGNPFLKRLAGRDRVDPMWKNPISLVQALIGAPIHWCAHCRLQFYDCRPLAEQPRERAAAGR